MTETHRSRRTAKHSAPSRWKARLLDIAILLTTGLICVFVFSFSTRLSYSRSETREPPIIIRVQILNACGRAGLARHVADRFAELEVGRMRFDVIDVGNFDRTDIRRSFAVNRTMEKGQARSVVAALGVGEVDLADGASNINDLGVDLTLVLGSNAVEPPEDTLSAVPGAVPDRP